MLFLLTPLVLYPEYMTFYSFLASCSFDANSDLSPDRIFSFLDLGSKVGIGRTALCYMKLAMMPSYFDHIEQLIGHIVELHCRFFDVDLPPFLLSQVLTPLEISQSFSSVSTKEWVNLCNSSNFSSYYTSIICSCAKLANIPITKYNLKTHPIYP